MKLYQVLDEYFYTRREAAEFADILYKEQGGYYLFGEFFEGRPQIYKNVIGIPIHSRQQARKHITNIINDELKYIFKEQDEQMKMFNLN